MAVAKIKKVEIVALKDRKDELVEKLQRLGAVHIESTEQKKTTALEHEKKLSDLLSAINYLSRFEERKENFVQSFFDSREIVDEVKLFRSPVDESLLSEVFGLSEEERKIREERKKASELMESLELYSKLDVPLELLGEGKDFSSAIGYMDLKSFESLERPSNVHIEELARKGNYVYLFVIRPRGTELNGFVEARFESNGRPSDIIGSISDRLGRDELKSIEEKAKALLPRLEELRLAYDSILLEKERIEKAEGFQGTESTVIIEGYVRKSDMQRVKALEDKGVAVIEHDVNPDEAPVELEEKPFFRPFELLMKIYGTPKYGSIDPVPIIALPFAFFFGYCLGDVGYGIILMAISFFLPKRIKMGKDGRALFYVLLWGGLFSIIVGIPTGSIFGDLTGFAGLVSPLDNPADLQTMMIIPIAIGLVYTGFGYVIGLYNKVKSGDTKSGIFDVLPWALISFSAFYIVMQMLLGGSLSLQSPAIYVILIAVLIVLFTHGRSHKGFGKVIYGIAGVYGIVNILSDALSFIRLFALGLSTYVLAYVFNLLAKLSLGIPYLGIVLFAIVLLVGHAFIFLMSGIGSFVHSLRLQYVEFFGKFFEGGEKSFKPFEGETRFFKRGE